MQRLGAIFVLGTTFGTITISAFLYITAVLPLAENREKTIVKEWKMILAESMNGKKIAGEMTAVAISSNKEVIQEFSNHHNHSPLDFIKHTFDKDDAFNDIEFELVDEAGHVLLRSWESASPTHPNHDGDKNYFEWIKANNHHLVADLALTDRGINIVSGTPVYDHNEKEVGIIFIYQGFSNLISYLKQQDKVDYLILKYNQNKQLEAKPSKWFNPDAMALIKKNQYQYKTGKEVGISILEDKALIDLPLINHHGELLGRQVVLMDAEEYLAPINHEKIAIFKDILVIVFIDILINLLVLMTVFRDAIQPLQGANKELQRIVDGDLTTKVSTSSSAKDMRYFFANLEKMRGSLHEMVDIIKISASALTQSANDSFNDVKGMQAKLAGEKSLIDIAITGSETVSEYSVEVGNRANEGAQQVASSAQIIQQNSVEVGRSTELVRSLSVNIKSSGEQVADLINEVSDIELVLNDIKEVAEQTNLLALNAAIEAARAGDHGRGFAVVSDEVRKLAAKTQVTVSEVEGILNKIKAKADAVQAEMNNVSNEAKSVVEVSNKIKEDLTMIEQSSLKVSEQMSSIRGITTQQQSAGAQVRENFKQVDQASVEVIQTAEITLERFEHVLSLSIDLTKKVEHFK